MWKIWFVFMIPVPTLLEAETSDLLPLLAVLNHMVLVRQKNALSSQRQIFIFLSFAPAFQWLKRLCKWNSRSWNGVFPRLLSAWVQCSHKDLSKRKDVSESEKEMWGWVTQPGAKACASWKRQKKSPRANRKECQHLDFGGWDPFWVSDLLNSKMGFPGCASGKEPACQCRRLTRHRLDPCVEKVLRRKAWQPTPVFLPEESLDRVAWWATVQITKSQTWLKLLSTHAWPFWKSDFQHYRWWSS